MNVLVIPEDCSNDGFVLRPILDALFRRLERPAKVEVLRDPVLRGVDKATDVRRLTEIVQSYRYCVQVFLLCVDRDGDQYRRQALDGLERRLAEVLEGGRLFVAEHAWQELEVWLLAGQDLPPDWIWSDIRAERDVKERFFEPWAVKRRLLDEPGGGRKTMGEEAAAKYKRVRSRCREDLQELERRLREWFENGALPPWDGLCRDDP